MSTLWMDNIRRRRPLALVVNENADEMLHARRRVGELAMDADFRRGCRPGATLGEADALLRARGRRDVDALNLVAVELVAYIGEGRADRGDPFHVEDDAA
jgi:hypothetical protein